MLNHVLKKIKSSFEKFVLSFGVTWLGPILENYTNEKHKLSFMIKKNWYPNLDYKPTLRVQSIWDEC